MSLANYFDVKEPQDFLRGLLNALMEFDQSKEDGERPKMVSRKASHVFELTNSPKAFTFPFGETKATTGSN